MKFLDETGLKFIATKFKELRESLSGYAKKEEIPTKVSQLKNDEAYVRSSWSDSIYLSLAKNPFFDMAGKVFEIKKGWNQDGFQKGLKIYISSGNKPDSPAGDGDYLVFTTFNATADSFGDDPKLEGKVTQIVLGVASGSWFVRYGESFNHDSESDFSKYYEIEHGKENDLPYSVHPNWGDWEEITKDFAMKEDITKALANIKSQIDLSDYAKKADLPTLEEKEKLKQLPYVRELNGMLDKKLNTADKAEMSSSTNFEDDKSYTTPKFVANAVGTLSGEMLGSVQEEIDKKADKSEIKTKLSEMTDDDTHRLVTDDEKTTWNGKMNSDQLIVGDTITREQERKYGYNKLIPSFFAFNSSLEGFDRHIKGYVDGKLPDMSKYKQQVILTQTEYDKLSSTDKNNASKIYFIKE